MTHEPECRWPLGTGNCACTELRAAYARGRDDEQDRSLVSAIFHAPDDGPQSFALVRTVDVSGVSGTGTVAYGVEFPDGTVALRWIGGNPTSVVFHDNGMESVKAIHGHGGATQIVWLSEDLGPRATEMDECEARGYARGREDALAGEKALASEAYDRGRADEREAAISADRVVEAFARHSDNYDRGYADALEAAAQRVEALTIWQDTGINGMEEDPDGWAIDRDDALAAIRGEGA